MKKGKRKSSNIQKKKKLKYKKWWIVIGLGILIALIILIIVFVSNKKESSSSKLNLTDIPNENVTYYLVNTPVNLSPTDNNNDFSKTNKLHYSHMPIIYKYFNSCGITEKNQIEYAFREITNATNGSVTFLEGDNYDILLTCATSIEGKTGYGSDYYTDTWGEEEFTDMEGNIILKANVTFYPFITSCGYYPIVELHEILHALGYEWNLYGQWHYSGGFKCSIMGAESDCKLIYRTCEKPSIDKDIVDDLKCIYNKTGTCYDVNFKGLDWGCENGWYAVEGTNLCCPEPNMTIVDGYCSH